MFVPSVERDGVTAVDQPRWVNGALEMFGRVFGGDGVPESTRHLARR